MFQPPRSSYKGNGIGLKCYILCNTRQTIAYREKEIRVTKGERENSIQNNKVCERKRGQGNKRQKRDSENGVQGQKERKKHI